MLSGEFAPTSNDLTRALPLLDPSATVRPQHVIAQLTFMIRDDDLGPRALGLIRDLTDSQRQDAEWMSNAEDVLLGSLTQLLWDAPSGSPPPIQNLMAMLGRVQNSDLGWALDIDDVAAQLHRIQQTDPQLEVRARDMLVLLGEDPDPGLPHVPWPPVSEGTTPTQATLDRMLDALAQLLWESPPGSSPQVQDVIALTSMVEGGNTLRQRDVVALLGRINASGDELGPTATDLMLVMVENQAADPAWSRQAHRLLRDELKELIAATPHGEKPSMQDVLAKLGALNDTAGGWALRLQDVREALDRIQATDPLLAPRARDFEVMLAALSVENDRKPVISDVVTTSAEDMAKLRAANAAGARPLDPSDLLQLISDNRQSARPLSMSQLSALLSANPAVTPAPTMPTAADGAFANAVVDLLKATPSGSVPSLATLDQWLAEGLERPEKPIDVVALLDRIAGADASLAQRARDLMTAYADRTRSTNDEWMENALDALERSLHGMAGGNPATWQPNPADLNGLLANAQRTEGGWALRMSDVMSIVSRLPSEALIMQRAEVLRSQLAGITSTAPVVTLADAAHLLRANASHRMPLSNEDLTELLKDNRASATPHTVTELSAALRGNSANDSSARAKDLELVTDAKLDTLPEDEKRAMMDRLWTKDGVFDEEGYRADAQARVAIRDGIVQGIIMDGIERLYKKGAPEMY
ncbi:hypothetical protein [Ramlibacter sp.]|uniref:hypothetical protein n=1 Tax=Ramlibacter sp. TaxID=1917967 RepID=UPI003D0F509F